MQTYWIRNKTIFKKPSSMEQAVGFLGGYIHIYALNVAEGKCHLSSFPEMPSKTPSYLQEVCQKRTEERNGILQKKVYIYIYIISCI